MISIWMKQKIGITLVSKSHFLFIICFFFFLLGSLESSYSQNIIPEPSYCNSDTPVTFRITAPGGKTWACNVAGVIVNTGSGEAVFSPALVPGPFPRNITIHYQNPNYMGEPAAPYDPLTWFYSYTVTITTPPIVSFAPIADVCVNGAIFPLAPRGNPAGGIYTGAGVDAGGFFHPSVAGAGTHSISYTYPSVGCNAVAYQMVTVRALPPVSLAPFSSICIDAAPITLTTGSPGGGTYSGTGVAAGMFNPGTAGVGTHTITYTFSDGFCTNSASQTITVNPLPAVTIGGLLAQQCDTDPPYTITGFPTEAAGTFIGNGITDNGNGTAIFNPGTSGLGIHNIIYTYTAATGCSNSNLQKARVGTELFMNGLASNYCANNPATSFTYTPANSVNPLNRVSGPGITDNLNGTATFNPAAATVGNNTIRYTFWDDIGCENIITRSVFVSDAPVADFSGFNATSRYCFGSGDVLLTGNHPGGSFTGPAGCIADNGNGTATFRPSVLTEGIYSISYTYANSAGCTDTEIKNIEILALPASFVVTGGGAYCSGTVGAPVGLSGSTSGINYQLFRDGFPVMPVNIQAGNGVPINFGNQLVTGVYAVTATNSVSSCSRPMNGSTTVSAIPQATIASQPVSAEVCETGSAVFLITASGQNLTYAWTNNGVPAGGNSNILALNGITMADNGHQIVCRVTSTCPAGFSQSSAPATLTVNPNTTITTHPASIVKCTGTSHTFTVTATGVNNTYLWRKGATDIVETPGKYINANTPDLTILDLTTADNGNYICYINGICGPEVQSNPATLTVDAPIVITSQPASISNCAGSNVTFSTAASGTNLTYQWFFSNGGVFVPVGANSSTLPVNNIAAVNTGTYYCRISSACGANATTNSVTLTIPATTAIVSNPAGSTICEGSNFNFSVNASGAALQYGWYLNGTLLSNGGVVSNATSANLSLTGTTLAYAGNYYVTVTGTCGTVTSAPAAVLNIRQQISFTGQPVSQTVCSGSDASFSVSVSGAVAGYQWQINQGAGFTNIPGATGSAYTVVAAASANAGNYRCMISTTTCGAYYSNEATLTINPSTTILTQPIALRRGCTGSNISFSVVASGLGLNYQWYKDGVSLGAGYTNATLNLAGITPSSAGSYTCIITGICGTMISQPGVLTVDIPVVISNHPQSQPVCVNTSHELSVTLSAGTNVTYQWYFNGLTTGTNSPVFTIPNFTVAEAGDYYVTITNGCGTVTSQTARLTLVNNFTITQQPVGVSVCENGAASFSVTASQPGVSYQWRKDGVDIPGATASSIILNIVTLPDNGSAYSCVVSNTCGAMTSNTAVLNVLTAVTITQQPQSGIGCPGQSYSIVLTASGSNLTYQWYRLSTGLIAGATGAAYNIPNFAAGNADTYYCVVSNDCGTVTSTNAVISAGAGIVITNPLPLSLCNGADATFTITATGTNPHYEWRKNFIPLIDDGRIVGSATNSLTIQNVIPGDEGTYDIIVTGECGLPATSTGAFLDITTPPVITLGPVPQTVCSGSNANFSVTLPVVPGDPLPTYRWQRNGINIVPAETGSTLNITGATIANAGIYRCVVTNSCGSINSTSAELVIEQNLNISSQPVSVTQCEGTNATFAVGVTGPTNMVLRWYKDGSALIENAHITGVNLPVLSIDNITTADGGLYWCEITSSCGNISSGTGSLTVQEKITFNNEPVSISVLTGTTATFTVAVSGNVTGYQWYLGNTPLSDLAGEISGATTSVLTILNAQAPGDEGFYHCVVTGICGNVDSRSATLTVLTSTVITTQPLSPVNQCEGTSLSLFITTSGAGHTYQWKVDDNNLTEGTGVTGVQTASLTINNTTPANSGTYTCVVDGVEISSSSIVTINPATVITVNPVGGTKCLGGNHVFSVSADGANLTYQWYRNNLATPVGVNSNTYSISPLTIADNGTYFCVVTGSCGTRQSSGATLTVNDITVVNTQPLTTTRCEGSTINLTFGITGSGLTYLWYKNGQPITDPNITGVNTNMLQISNSIPSNNGDYTCTVTSSCSGVITSNIAILTVNPTTNITIQPVGRTRCEGDGVVFTVEATGANLVYDWRRNNISLGLPSNSSLTLNGLVKAANEGTYTCVVTGACGIQTSVPAILIVNRNITIAAPVISTNPVCQGASATITINATGDGLTYLWQKNGQLITGANISGLTSGVLVISNSVLTDAGAYTCTVTNSCGSVTSDIAALQVNPTTIITSQPAGQTLCEGDNVQFMVTAAGAMPLSYQWRLNNNNIIGANSSTLTINGITPANGGTYTCMVTGASTCGAAVSDPANLVVNPRINITVQPTSATVCEDNVAIFSLLATGTNLSYKWKFNEAYISDNGRITGANTNELSIALSTNADEGIYKCEIFSDCGVTESNSVILNVTDSTKITTHPLSQTLLQGSTASFNVSATGEGLTYQWQRDNVSIPGATSGFYSIANIQPADAGSYRCIVSGNCGQIISKIAVLTINQPVNLTLQPVSIVRCAGQSASFTVAATGTIVSYQWQFNGANMADGTVITGTRTANLVISSVNNSNAGNYSCIVTGSNNIANSNVATLAVNAVVAIAQQPLSQTKCNGDILILEVTPADLSMTYSWELNGTPLSNGGRISGVNTYILVITNISNVDAGSYRCNISNACGSVTSNPAIVTVNQVFSVTANPSSINQCAGQSAFFSVTTNISTLDYQWYRNGVPLSNTSRITGVNTANLIINNLVLADQGSYSCLISDNCSSINSLAAVLTVRNVAVISSQPSDKTVCEDENTFIEVNATGDNLVYQWQKDGLNLTDAGNIFGSQSSILIIQNTTLADQGVYRCNVSSTCNSLLTNTSNLTVNALPGAAGPISGDNVICQGTKGVLYVVPAISNATSYEWTLPYDATIVSGAGTRSIVVNYSTSSLSGVVSVRGINGCGSGSESPALAVTVNNISIAAAGADQTLCSNTATLNGNVPVFGSGQWTTLSGLALIANPNNPTSPVSNLGQGSNLFVWTVTENGCVAKDSLVITNRIVPVYAGADQSLCSLTSRLDANIPVTGQGRWSVISGGGVLSSVNDPKTNIINLARGTNLLRWTINNGGCFSYDEVTIVNDLPTNSNAGTDAIIVVDNYTLDGNNPAIGTGSWSLLSGSATITNPALYNTTVTNLGIGENTFQWTITNNLCYSQDAVKVINYTPTITDAGPAQVLCTDHTSLMGTIPNYGTGQWSVISGSGTFVEPYKFDSEVINIGKGLNTYRWTIYEYEITYDDVVITNNSPSTANAGIDQRLCDVNAVLAGNDPVIGTGVWSITGGSGSISNPTSYNSSILNLGLGSNTLRWTITNNSCSSFDEVVIINDRPTFADAGVDQITCADSVSLYPNTPTIGKGEWSVVEGSAFFAGNKAYNLARDNNLLKWTISNNGCFDSDTVLIVSNKPTTSYTGMDKSICVNSISLPGNTPAFGTGVWSMLNGSADFANVNDPKSEVTNLAFGPNRFRWTITYKNCSSFSDVNITYNYIQSDANADQTLCEGDAFLNANDPGTGTGQWSVVGGSGSAHFINPNQSNTEVTGLDRGNNILRWTITNFGCISSDEVVITNNNPTTAFAGSDRSVCGEDIFLGANNPAIGTGEWIVLSGSANIENTALYNSKVSNLSIGQNVLRWTITNQNCISSDEVVIKNNKPPNIEAGQSLYLCSDSAQLYATAPAGGSGRWSISEGSANFVNNTLYNTMVHNLEKGENKLVWTVTIGGCSNSDTVVISNNLPSTPGAGPDQDICADNAFMSANQPLLGTGRWSIVSGSAVFDNLYLPNTKATHLGNGPNILRWTITNGSCPLYDEVTITNSLPTVAYAGEDRSVCNTTANLLSAVPVSGTGSWSIVSGYGVFADPKKFDTQITNLGFGPNTLRWTTENGRCRTSDDIIITNNLAEAYAGTDQTVYVSDTRLVGNKPASGIGQWVVLAGQGTFANAANFETNVLALGGGANTFSWTINNDGCIASDDVVIAYKILPKVDFDPLPAFGCAPLTVSFVNNSVGGAPFSWDFGDGTRSNSANIDHTYNIPGSYKVRLSGTGPDGKILYRDTTIIVQKVPVAQFEVTPDTAYLPGRPVHFFNLTENIDSLYWEFGDGNSSREQDPSYTYPAVGSYNVTLHVWSGFRCYDSRMISNAVIVERAGILKCPNAFTPNPNGPSGGHFNPNDFSNDVFHCYTEGIVEYHLEIYNRLGIILFTSDDINIGWDGYFKGKLVENGAYVFKVYGRYNNGERFDHFGNIILLH